MRGFFNYLKPNFNIKHPLNILFLVLLFVGFFSSASIATAATVYYATPSPTATKYSSLEACFDRVEQVVQSRSYQINSCSLKSKTTTSYYGTSYHRWNWECQTEDINGYINPDGGLCHSSTSQQLVWTPPPESCQDLVDNNPDGVVFSLSTYESEICSQGCRMTTGAQSRASGDSEWSGTGTYTGQECDGGFNAESGIQTIDAYSHDDDLQNCYDSNGRLIGQISVSASCPQLSVCYDASTGESIGTTSSSTACESGVKYNELSSTVSPSDKSTATTTTVDADGTTTEVKETVSTQTGLDGSEEVVKETTTIVRDANGQILDNTTVQETSTVSAQSPCESNPNLAECQVKDDQKVEVKLSDNCVTPPACSGDPVGCSSLIIQWEQQCSTLTPDGFDSWKASADGQSYSEDVDQYGQMMGMDAGTVDLAQELNLSGLGDNGDAGVCPSPHTLAFGLLGSASFEYTTICQAASVGRPIVIFAAMWLSFVMVRRKLLEV